MRFRELKERVARMEIAEQQSPAWFRLRTVLLIVFGYAAIIAISGGMLLVLLAAVAVSYGLVIFLARAFVVQWMASVAAALFRRSPPPQGIPITALDAPLLFARLQRMSGELRSPAIREVYVTGAMNAALVQRPRFWLFGRRTHIEVGLPLLNALSEKEVEAVLGHELGHASKRHGGIRPMAYRTYQTWMIIEEEMAQQAASGIDLVRHFIDWFAPRILTRTFVLSRAHEIEADAMSAQCVGAEVMGQALVRMPLADHAMQRFSDDLADRIRVQPEPPRQLEELNRRLRQTLDDETKRSLLEAELERETTLDDTHPALRDRLRALGVEAKVPTEPRSRGTDLFPPGLLESIEKQLDELSYTAACQAWHEKHRELVTDRRRRDALRDKEALDADEAHELAELTLQLEGADAALQLARANAATNPNHARSLLLAGSIILLEKEDISGAQWISRAMELEGRCRLPGAELLLAWAVKHENEELIQTYSGWCQQAAWEWKRAALERHNLHMNDHYLPHDFSGEPLEELRSFVYSYPDIEHIYILRKVVQYLPEEPAYVLAFSLHQGYVESWINYLSNHLKLPGNASFTVLAMQQIHQEFIYRLVSVPGAYIERPGQAHHQPG